MKPWDVSLYKHCIVYCLFVYFPSFFEVNAVFAADAVARLSGKVGVAAVTAGPGYFLLHTFFVISCCCLRCRNKEENIVQERTYDITLVLQLYIDNVTLNISFCLHTGLTNTVTAIKNAQMAESPLLLMGGAAATLLKVKTLKRLFFI